MHLAETFEQATDDVRHGLSIIEDYRAHINPAPPIDYFDIDAIVDAFNDSGAAVIGTPEMRTPFAQINRLIEKSGGFGTYLLMGVDWASYPATERSHQLFAEEVMPHFNGSLAPMTEVVRRRDGHRLLRRRDHDDRPAGVHRRLPEAERHEPEGELGRAQLHRLTRFTESPRAGGFPLRASGCGATGG